MRIAFCGPSGSGKTTLAKAVAEEFKLTMEEWPLPSGDGFESTTRYTARQLTGEPLPYKVDETGQRAEFQRVLLRNKLEWEFAHSKGGFVTDRTHADNLAYSILHDIADTGSCPKFWRDAAGGMSNYDLVIFMPQRDFGGDVDAARKASPVYQKAYCATLSGLLKAPLLVWRTTYASFPRSITSRDQSRDWVFGCIHDRIARRYGYHRV